MAIKKFQDFTGGLNLTQSTKIADNEFKVIKNMFYNRAGQLQSRRGRKKFGSQIGSSPITSYFFFQRDDNQERIAVAHSGTNLYALDATNKTRSSIVSNKREYETLPNKTGNRVRRDFATYKNTIYMCNGVDNYCSYDGTTYSDIGVNSGVTCTFDSSTDLITKAAHGLSDGDELYFTSSGDMPTGVTENQVYYVVTALVNTFAISTTKDGDSVDFSTNGTGTIQFFELTEPRTRYIEYMQDRLFSAGDDANPITLYYTNAAPTDGTDINQNSVVIGGDEQGVINGVGEYNQLPLVFKSDKVYGVNVATPSVSSIDSQTGGYSNRSINNVGNSLVYFNERGLDTLNKRSGVDGVGAIESKSLSEKVRELTKLIEERQYNSCASKYIKALNNYYFSFDTNNDNVPDTHLVYNSAVSAWTQYVMPPLYDYGEYMDDNQAPQYLFASASGGQMFEFETGFDDDGVAIDFELQTKDRDFNDPAQQKIFDFVDVTGYKQEGGDVCIEVIVDGNVVVSGDVTDTQLNLSTPAGAIGTSPLGINPLGVNVGDTTSGLPMYFFTVKLPFYHRGSTVSVRMKSTGVQQILEKIRVSVNGEVNTMFSYNHII